MCPSTGIYTKVSVVPYRPSNKENFHIFIKGLAKNTFTNMYYQGFTPLDMTKLSIFQKRTTLTGYCIVTCRLGIQTNL